MQSGLPLQFRFPDYSELSYTIKLDDNGLWIRIVLLSSAQDKHHQHASPCPNSEAIRDPVTVKETEQMFVHWGITLLDSPGTWVPPTENLRALKHFQWPPHTTLAAGAAQTAFPPAPQGSAPHERVIEFGFPSVTATTPLQDLPRTFEFVLFSPPDTWRKTGKANFVIPVSSSLQYIFSEQQLTDAVRHVLGKNAVTESPSDGEIKLERWTVKNNAASFSLLAYSFATADDYCATFFFCDTPHPVLLHWGLAFDESQQWTQADTQQLLPTAQQCSQYPFNDTSTTFTSAPGDSKSLQTDFQFVNPLGQSPVQYARILLKASVVPNAFMFVLKEKHSNTWFKNSTSDFRLPIVSRPAYLKQRQEHLATVEEARRKQAERQRERQELWSSVLRDFRATRNQRKAMENVRIFKSVTLAEGFGDLDVLGTYQDDALEVTFVGCFRAPAILHWGVVDKVGNVRRGAAVEWTCPPEPYRPKDTSVIDAARSCETPFSNTLPSAVPLLPDSDTSTTQEAAADFIQTVQLRIPATLEAAASEMDSGVLPQVEALVCVIREQDGVGWFKGSNNSDILLRLTSCASSAQWRGPLPDVIDDILGAELGWNHMTLMHRYNLMNAAIKQWNSSSEQEPLRTPAFYRTWTSLFRTNTAPVSPMDEDNNPIVLPTTDERLLHDPSQEGTERDLGVDFWSWMFVWGRFSYLGLLDWQRNYNTKPRELAHATECLTYTLADVWIQKQQYRSLIRQVLSTVARGGNQGQAIRDRILDIMHRHRIPEHGANFYEQWHQKLHNNTTPDDVAICIALIHFLKSGGNKQEYWNALSDHGITRERLASYERKITAEPFVVHTDIGALIGDLEHYLDILKDVHDSLDLKKAFHHSIGHLDSEAIDAVRDVLAHTKVSGLALKKEAAQQQQGASATDIHRRFTTIAKARRQLLYKLTRPQVPAAAIRELLFLDYALEQQEALCLQADNVNFSVGQLAEQVKEMIIQLSGHEPHNPLLHAMASDWVALSEQAVRNAFGHDPARESALLLKALADRVSLYVGQCVATLQDTLGAKACYMGLQLGIGQHVLNIFIDEVLRGSILFGISATLKRLEPLLRKAAALPPWIIISHAPRIQGRLVRTPRLANIQDKVYPEPTILLSGAVSGEEELPGGVQAVLVRSAAESPDILSHVSVRARNARVLLAVCFEPEIVKELDALEDCWIELTVPIDGSRVEYKRANQPTTHLAATVVSQFNRQNTQQELLEVPKDPRPSTSLSEMLACTPATQGSDESCPWVLLESQFSPATVGSKSRNLARLRQAMQTKRILTPNAVALPFTAFSRTLKAKENAGLSESLLKCLSTISKSASSKEVTDCFATARCLIQQLHCPPDLRDALEKALLECSSDGIAASDQQPTLSLGQLYDGQGDKACWKAICGVWGSVFQLRPWLSLAKAEKEYCDLRMAVLIQELLPASYAFVLHSRNPMAPESATEMYGEIVAGLGETLVGNCPGRALSWTMKRGGTPVITAFPSKQIALKNEGCLIFRSDSNGEDLEGFAGAGLFDSIPSQPNKTIVLSYSTLSLIRDTDFRQELLQRIGQLAFVIEDHFERPMDIEGVVVKDHAHIIIVQARSQV